MSADIRRMDPKSSRVSKRVVHGLEFPSKLTYLNWEPGGEYTQSLLMKNVKLTTQKVKFKLSSNQFSSSTCHQPLILCAGTSYALPVTFKPCKKTPCKEYIELETSDGKVITVPIKAVLSRPKLTVTDQLKFGLCAVKSSISVNFEISNIGNVSTFYSWESPNGFNVTPKDGVLEPKETRRHNATFCPQIAKVYEDIATCTYSASDSRTDDKMKVFTKVMKVEGVGKYPYVIVKKDLEYRNPPSTVASLPSDEQGHFADHVVDFSTVAVGNSADRCVLINNPSPVSCTFSVQSYMVNSDSVKSPFVCINSEKNIQPHSSTNIKIVYTPKYLSDSTDIGYFTIQARGSCGSAKIKCIGQSTGPIVCAENENCAVNFGNIQCGKVSTGLIHLRNESKVATLFQLHIGESSVFSCDTTSGTLGPSSSISISVKFVPKCSIPYCRPVSVIIKNQEPIFIYFIGTGFSEIQMPVYLQPKEIIGYLEHSQAGISLLPPDRLKDLVEKGMLVAEDKQGILKPSARSIVSLPPPQKCLGSSGFAKFMHSEMEISSIQHVTCDVEEIDFGYCSPTFSSDGKAFTITNHTYGEVSCVWVTTDLKCFEVLPPQRMILPRKTATFTVYFKPDKSDQFFNTEVECYIYYKDLSDNSHINPFTITPPWCITLLVSGHTFNRDFQTLISESSFDCEDIVFPPAVVGQSVYQSIVIRNFTTEPTVFSFKEDNDKIFKIKPSCGILKGEFQLVVIQMTPKEAKAYDCMLNCQLVSAASVHSKRLFLHGSGEIPRLSFVNRGQLYFKPTCIGTTTSLTHSVKNTSGIPLRFEWKYLNHVKDKIFSVQPMSGTILPNEIQDHTWCFTPAEPTEYKVKSVLHSYLSAPHIKSKTGLEIIGAGSTGAIKCDPAAFDFGVMIVGTSKYCHLSLSNSGPCDMKYSLKAHQDGESISSEVVELSQVEGVIHARSTVHIKVTVRPCHSERHCCTIKYSILSQVKDTNGQTILGGRISTDLPLCEITFLGVFPSLNIVDVQGGGVASEISKALLWKMLSINKINKSLNEVPLMSEMRYTIGSRHSLKRKIPVKSRTVIDCDFGAAPVNSENCVIHLVLKNDGAVSTEWAFLMSSDVWLEPEFWADFGELDEVEKNELFILTNELFTITPKKGRLEPGEHVLILFTHKHSHIGTIKLPVLLKINSGREIVLSLSGVTVEKGFPHLHIGFKQHVFDPVPIGIQSCPVQAFPLYNGGDSVIGYEVDTTILKKLMEQNYFMQIFECMKPVGTILPGRTLLLEFIFSPIEAKQYLVDVPLYLSTGESIMVTLVGEGYDHEDQALSRYIKEENYPFSENPMCPHDVVSFSHECLSFGCVPQFSTVERIVFIKNTSQYTLSYIWEKDSRKVITVEPAEGYIQPQKSAICRVVFSSASPPSSYSFDQLCKIINESEVTVHQAALRKWNEKNEDEKYALVITQDSDSTQQTLCNKSTFQMQASSELRSKLGTLPPIGESQQSYEEWKRSDLSIKSKKRPVSKKAVDRGPPVPPTPTILRLHVTAKTISVSDYVTLNGDLDEFHTDHFAFAPHHTSTCVQQQEVEFQKFVLNQIIKEILEDSNFQQALHRIIDEPIPYFSQFSTHLTEDVHSADGILSHQHSTFSHKGQESDSFLENEINTNGQLNNNVTGVSSEDNYTSTLPPLDNEEMTSIVEDVIHSTLFNVFIEANSHEFTVDRPLCTIAKSVL